MCFLLGNSLHVFLGKARLPSGQNFRRCNFTSVLMVFSWRSYLKFCFLFFFFIYDIQILFQLNLKNSIKHTFICRFQMWKIKGRKKNNDQQKIVYRQQRMKKKMFLNCIIKYLWINLTKEVKDLYTENYESLIKKIENYSKKWNNNPCS